MTLNISSPNLRKTSRFITKAKREHVENLTVVIPAAGPGTRMKLHGPKCLLKYKGETLLQRQIRTIRDVYENADIVVVVGFEWKKVVNSLWPQVRFVINEQYETTNVAKSIVLGLQATQKSNLLVMYGDLIYDSQILEKIPYNSSYVMYENSGHFKDSEVGIAYDKNRCTNLAYSLKSKWCQMIYVNSDGYYDFVSQFLNHSTNMMFGYEVLNKMIDGGYPLQVRHNESYFVKDIDTIQDYTALESQPVK